jgi:hypothetical protein
MFGYIFEDNFQASHSFRTCGRFMLSCGSPLPLNHGGSHPAQLLRLTTAGY